MGRSLSPEFRFRALLNDAEAEADHLRRLIGEALPGNVGRTDFPASTVMLLIDWAATLYEAGVILVRHPKVAAGAQIQLRSLVEIWAHVNWIYGPEEIPIGKDVACRAAKFEVGRFDQMLYSTSSVHSDSVEGGRAVELWRTLRETRDGYGEAHDALGCDGSIPELRGAIINRIEALEARTKQNWFLDLWRIASASTHGFAMEVVKESLSLGDEASFETRGRLLGRLMWIFNGIGVTSLALVRPDAKDRFAGRMKALGARQILAEAGGGKLD